MRKILVYVLWLALAGAGVGAAAQPAAGPVKNVIVMIPDGTSSPVVALSRWYQRYVEGGPDRLAIDPWFCGLVKTHCSDSPIGDSAPTTSSFMTGYYTRTGYINVYPPANPGNDLVGVDPARHYQPLANLPEAMRIVQGKSVGIVVTCEFPHATPADASAHYYARDNYDVISEQIVHNAIDVMLGGGNDILTPAQAAALQAGGAAVVRDDLAAFRRYDGAKLWALFGAKRQPYDLDRDTAAVPSLAEMTTKALTMLSKNPSGFFLLVEGSKVDMAAHNNDPMGMVTEFLAFDRAVAAAIEFAKQDGNTLVVILPDHGNSGISIGNRTTSSGYDKLSIERLMGPFRTFRMTAQAVTDRLNGSDDPELLYALFREGLGIELTVDEATFIRGARDYTRSPTADSLRTSRPLIQRIGDVIGTRTLIGFTTNGHTGEDVFLATYHPRGGGPHGLLDATELNRYLLGQVGMGAGALDSLTAQLYVAHDELFRGMNYSVAGTGVSPRLIVENKGRRLVVFGNTNRATLNGREIELPSLAVYIDRNGRFYLPRTLLDQVE